MTCRARLCFVPFLACFAHAGSLAWASSLIQVVVDAGRLEVRFLLERRAAIPNLGRVLVDDDDGQNELVGLVEAGEDFVLGDGDGLGSRDPALHFEEPQKPRAGDGGFDVVAEILVAHVSRGIAESAFGCHDGFHRQSLGPLGVDGKGRGCGLRLAAKPSQQSHGNDHRPAENDRRQCREFSLLLKLGKPLLKSAGQFVGPLPGQPGIELRVGPAGQFLVLELGGPVVPVVDFLGEAVLHGGLGLFDQSLPCACAPRPGVAEQDESRHAPSPAFPGPGGASSGESNFARAIASASVMGR